MTNRSPFRIRLIGMICLCTMAAGCTTTGGGWGIPLASNSRTDAQGPKNPKQLHLSYAKWQEHLGNISEARQSYEVVLGEDPKSVDALVGLARLDQLSGRTAEAEQGFHKALKLSPNDPNALEALGQFYASQEKWDRAVGVLQAAVQAAPNDMTTRYHFAVALAHFGRINESQTHFAQTVGEAQAHYNLGLILHKQGKIQASEQQFLQALQKNPDLEEAQYWLTEVRREKGGASTLANTGAAPQNDPYQQVGHSKPQHQSSSAPSVKAAKHDAPSTTSSQNWQARKPPQGMSPQQLEQWRNQRGGN